MSNAAEDIFKWAPPELVAEVQDLEELHALRARYDPVAFASYVMKDEETGKPIQIQPVHEEWHRLASYHPRLLLWAHVEAGKTQQMSIARALFELGCNPNLRICIVSNTDSQAQKICMTIGKYIESSAEYHKVFPEIRKASRMPWTMHQLYVVRSGQAKDPSIRTCGIHGSILGARIDLLIIDDILDYENSVSAHQRDDLYNWFNATLETRLTRKSRILCIGTAWHREDIMHRFAKREDWVAVRYPVMDEETGQLNWPERWPLERIEAKRVALGPIEFNRSLLCVARSDEEARFKKAWIDTCLARGEGKSMIWALQQVPDGYATFTGVDLGVRVKAGSDLTSIFTILVHPDESRQVIDIEAGRWPGPEIVEKIIEVHRKYQSIVLVENNAAQEFIVQFTKAQSAVPVKSFTTTGQNVRSPQFGLEGLATEMSNGKWIIPNNRGKVHPQVGAWINEMLYYDPLGHPGDRLMSSWFAKEGSRLTKPKARIGRLDLLKR